MKTQIRLLLALLFLGFSIPTMALSSPQVLTQGIFSSHGKKFLKIVFNTLLSEQEKSSILVTNSKEQLIVGDLEIQDMQATLSNSVLIFTPDDEKSLDDVITVKIDQVTLKVVPGTSSMATLGQGSLASAGYAYKTSEASSLVSSFHHGGISVLDIIPRNGLVGVAPTSNIVIFFSDVIDIDSIKVDNFTVTHKQSGESVPGTLGVTTSTAGNTIVTFVPDAPLMPFTEYLVKVNEKLIKHPIFDELPKLEEGEKPDLVPGAIYNSVTCLPVRPFSSTFKTGNAPLQSSILDNLEFQKGTLEGMTAYGDVQVVKHYGSIQKDSPMALLTTLGGQNQSSSQAGAYGANLTTSSFTIPTGMRFLNIDLDFITAEFPQFVGSIYDDTLLLTLHTPFGVQTLNAVSVNSLGQFNHSSSTSTNGVTNSLDKFLPFEGDFLPTVGEQKQNGRTTFHTRSFNVSHLAGKNIPMTLTFQLTNVGDNIYQTSVLLDKIYFTKNQPSMKVTTEEFKTIAQGHLGEQDRILPQGNKTFNIQSRKDNRFVLLQSKKGVIHLNLINDHYNTLTLKGDYRAHEDQVLFVQDSLKKFDQLEFMASFYVLRQLNSSTYELLRGDTLEPVTTLVVELIDLVPLQKAVDQKRRELTGDHNVLEPIPTLAPFKPIFF